MPHRNNRGWRNNPTDRTGYRHGLSARGIKNAPSKQMAMNKSMGMNNNYVLSRAFHPTKFEKGVYAVSFHKKGQPLLNRNIELYQVKAKNRQEAIKKARMQLKEKIRKSSQKQMPTGKIYRILVQLEGKGAADKTPILFGSRQEAETFANIETAAGMGERYSVVEETGRPIPKNLMVQQVGKDVEVTNTKTGRTVKLSKEGDYDRDGIMNRLDCDPTDPEQQGFFDTLKRGVQKVISKKPTEQEVRELRSKLEQREEELEKKKEETLIKLKSKREEELAAKRLRAKEQELDDLQSQLEEGTLKEKLKFAARSGISRAGITLRKRLQGKKTTLSKREISRTSPQTLKRLEKARKKKEEAEAKLQIQQLEKQTKNIQSQLEKKPRKRRKKINQDTF